ncbi:MAG: DUF721 domain-containing protein [Spirochaetia bacterium]|jgi:predicted nucleic acid-binding Zn ribbon protein|nr:DUF721 domain-containing protein [Spirochaetia bacterium]
MNFKINNNGRKQRLLSFNELMADVINELNIKDDFFIIMLKNNWEKIAGGIVSVHSVPDRIFKNILFISADHSVYANEIIMMKNIILQKIGDSIGQNIIKTVKVEIRHLNWH